VTSEGLRRSVARETLDLNATQTIQRTARIEFSIARLNATSWRLGHDVTETAGSRPSPTARWCARFQKSCEALRLMEASQVFALVKVHVWDARVEAERVVAAAEGPEVNVMDFLHAFDGEHGGERLLPSAVHATAFEKDVRGFAQDADARPQHKQSDGEAEERINPVRAGDVNDDRAGDDGDVERASPKLWIRMLRRLRSPRRGRAPE